jgi:hypothetical protein
MRKTWLILACVVAIVAIAGCAKPPAEQIEQAKQAVQDAQAADAATYAPQDLSAAEDAQKRLDAELKLQEEKFALFRSYKQATTLAAEVKSAGEQASAAAADGKEKAKQEATQQIADTQALLDEVRALLAKAPRGKGSEADIAAMSADLDAVGAALAEANASLQSGDYRDAQNKAAAARSSVEQVKTDIETAIEMRSGAQRKSS